MSTKNLSEFCKGTAVLATVYGSINAIVNGSVAWGTRFVNQIPTQALVPAIMSSFIHSFTFTLSIMLVADDDNKRSRFLIAGVPLLIATLVTVTTTPTLATFAKRTISYKEATAFALLSNITSFILFRTTPQYRERE